MALAKRFRAEMTLFHAVLPLVSYGSPEAVAYTTVQDLTKERMESARAQLDAFLAEELRDVKVTRIVEEDDPASAIVARGRADKADLIVMPTHGYGPFRRLLLGSVTAKVLHDAGCPVWTGPHLEQAPALDRMESGRLVCAIDLGEESEAVLRWGGCMARQLGAALTVAHVIPYSMLQSGGVYFDPDWRAKVAGTARERIVELQERTGAEGDIHIEIGDVPEAVQDVARELGASLMVIGRHGHHTGLLSGLLTHVYGIIRDAPCPVVAI